MAGRVLILAFECSGDPEIRPRGRSRPGAWASGPGRFQDGAEEVAPGQDRGCEHAAHEGAADAGGADVRAGKVKAGQPGFGAEIAHGEARGRVRQSVDLAARVGGEVARGKWCRQLEMVDRARDLRQLAQ
jgi:hypothetical protein